MSIGINTCCQKRYNVLQRQWLVKHFWVSFSRSHGWQKGANIASVHNLCFPCSEEYSRKCAQINSLLLVALSLFYSNVLTISSQPWFKTCPVYKWFQLLLHFYCKMSRCQPTFEQLQCDPKKTSHSVL